MNIPSPPPLAAGETPLLGIARLLAQLREPGRGQDAHRQAQRRALLDLAAAERPADQGDVLLQLALARGLLLHLEKHALAPAEVPAAAVQARRLLEGAIAFLAGGLTRRSARALDYRLPLREAS